MPRLVNNCTRTCCGSKKVTSRALKNGNRRGWLSKKPKDTSGPKRTDWLRACHNQWKYDVNYRIIT
jgi:hypothetical protein